VILPIIRATVSLVFDGNTEIDELLPGSVDDFLLGNVGFWKINCMGPAAK
jgi:hypothetical protein